MTLKTQRGGDLLDGFVGKKQLDRVEEMFDETSTAGAVDLMADEIRQIAKAARAMLSGGLTEDCLVVLMQAKLPKEPNGRPVAGARVKEMLQALSTLDSFTKPVKP